MPGVEQNFGENLWVRNVEFLHHGVASWTFTHRFLSPLGKAEIKYDFAPLVYTTRGASESGVCLNGSPYSFFALVESIIFIAEAIIPVISLILPGTIKVLLVFARLAKALTYCSATFKFTAV